MSTSSPLYFSLSLPCLLVILVGLERNKSQNFSVLTLTSLYPELFFVMPYDPVLPKHSHVLPRRAARYESLY